MRKFILLSITMCLLGTATGCANNNKHGDSCECNTCIIKETNKEKQKNSGNDDDFLLLIHEDYYSGFYEYKDPETGVHYLIKTSGSGGTAITLMYNADGTLKAD